MTGDLLAAACRRYGQRPALVRGDETRTHGELLEQGTRLANALRGAGLAPGTPVAAMLEDRISSLEVYVGAAFGGGRASGASAAGHHRSGPAPGRDRVR